MRNGILLAEDSPQSIISHFEVQSLEDAFLQLCMKHGISDEASQNLKQVHAMSEANQLTNVQSQMNNSTNNDNRKNSISSDNDDACCGGVADINCNKKSLMKKLQFTTKRRMKALLAKNFLQMLRQPA